MESVYGGAIVPRNGRTWKKLCPHCRAEVKHNTHRCHACGKSTESLRCFGDFDYYN